MSQNCLSMFERLGIDAFRPPFFFFDSVYVSTCLSEPRCSQDLQSNSRWVARGIAHAVFRAVIRSLLRKRPLGDALLDGVAGRERGGAAQKPVDTLDRRWSNLATRDFSVRP